MRAAPWKVLAAAAAVCAAGSQSYAARKKPPAPPAVTEGTLETRDGDKIVDVPLEHTQVTIHATGHLATVEVEQIFKNPYDKKIEAIYLFPLPTGAAVDGMELEVGGRVIQGEIEKRAEAKATYERARSDGLVAALLTQERPNLFTQHVANLEPGARVKVRLSYLEPLVYQDGGYEIVYPMVAPPRYMPKASAQAGEAKDVQPSVLPEGQRPATDIGLTVEIDAGVPLRGVSSPSHKIVTDADQAAPSRATVNLAKGDTIPNKDFILRYDVAGDKPGFAVLAHKEKEGQGAQGAFFLTMVPPKDVAPADVTPRELVFVIDTSSSMRGAPLAKGKELVKKMIGDLGPQDTFQIVRFADAASALGEKPLANKPNNVKWAGEWLEELQAEGGTEMTEGIAAALDFPHDPARLRLVVFITDGYVGNEDEILKTVHDKLGASRLYSFGVGTAVNRYLLEEMASFGRGDVQVVRPDEDTQQAVAKLHDRLSRPVLTDVRFEWQGLDVSDVTPAAAPDLFAGATITLAGHYAKGGMGVLVVHGMAAGREVTFRVPVSLPDKAIQPQVATVWARARIAELTRLEIRGATEATTNEIVGLALAYHLMTRYTAFVVVDRSRATIGGPAQPVAVPVAVPEGLAYSGGYGGDGGGSIGVGYGAGEGHAVAYDMAIGDGVGYGGGYTQPDHVVTTVSKEPPLEARSAGPASPPVADEASPRDDEVTLAAQATKQGAQLKKVAAAKLKDNPAAKGKYVLAITVNADGTVKTVTVKSKPDGGAEAAAAVATEARAWKFSAPGKEITFELALSLE
jgi:Ca-activated chloride channel family protein